jgi:hypothetical protein
MTKEVFAGFFKKSIPVVGGVVGGSITFATFKPCCYRLKDALKDTILSNPDHKETDEENKLFEKTRKTLWTPPPPCGMIKLYNPLIISQKGL